MAYSAALNWSTKSLTALSCAEVSVATSMEMTVPGAAALRFRVTPWTRSVMVLLELVRSTPSTLTWASLAATSWVMPLPALPS